MSEDLNERRLANKVMEILRREVMKELQIWHGYECERNVDGFVLAFHKPADAVQFSVDLYVHIEFLVCANCFTLSDVSSNSNSVHS